MRLPTAKSISRRNPGCPVPDMAPAAGMALALIGLFLLAANPRWPNRAVVALEALPHSGAGGPCLLFEGPSVLIGLDTKGHFSFATEGNLQAAVVEKVSKEHHLTLSNSQLAKLEALPFLSTTVEQLSIDLAASRPANLTIGSTQPNYLLTESQLVECATTAKHIAPSVTGGPVYFSLLIDAETGTSKVMNLLTLLRAQGINRFVLRTRE